MNIIISAPFEDMLLMQISVKNTDIIFFLNHYFMWALGSVVSCTRDTSGLVQCAVYTRAAAVMRGCLVLITNLRHFTFSKDICICLTSIKPLVWTQFPFLLRHFVAFWGENGKNKAGISFVPYSLSMHIFSTRFASLYIFSDVSPPPAADDASCFV